ncbi:MAG: carbohydrate ABC transporter permease [Clostridia bacterium]|nr:carbohydrate ABC transporter permease [Clostridia bacterium]
MKRKSKLKNRIELTDVVVFILSIVALIIVFLPFMNVVSLSLSSSDSIVKGEVTFLPIGFNLDSYAEIMKTSKIVRSYINSIVYTVTAVFLGLFMCTITAYPLSRKFMWGRKAVVGMIMFTMFFSGGMIPMYLLVQNLGMMDTIWGLVVPWAVPAYELFLLKNYFENVPYEIYEAATIDGASEYRILYDVFVPLAKPMFATIAIFFALGQWNSYMIPLLYISTPEKFPLQIVLQQMLIKDEARGSINLVETSALTSQGLKNATVVISILPILITYPFLQRYFIGDLYVGSVKG